MIEKGGVKAAVFGILGTQADSYAPLSGLYFKNYIEAAKEITEKIKAETAADIIICLSHSGTDDNPKRSEDELLAAAVPNIDVIISGHTHTTLNAPIVIGNTVIVSCGEHAYKIGHLKLVRSENRYKVSGYELIPINGDLQKDAVIEAAILKFREMVDTRYFSRFGYSFDQKLACSNFAFTPIEHFGKIQGEDTLGNLISDSYIAAVKKAEGSSYRKVDVAVVPQGVVRGSFTEGVITAADAFNVSSLGIGPDRIPGYPLVSIYLTGKELKTAAEIDASVSTLMLEARLYMSGLSYTYNPNRLLLNRITKVRLMSLDGTMSELGDKELYRVIGGLYSCQMLGAVEAQSFGLLKVTPKDKNGDPITDFEKHIVYDGDAELKEWVALASYLESFEKIGGISVIPEYYNKLHGRKVEETSRSPAALLKNPNKIFFILLGALMLILAVITVPTVLIIRKVRREKS
ncbi:MAG: 5'-nucleotidase C-terminal domain-containing protein [Brevinematales bacterium]|nr:5'-nucleotidase C-terminal domain-containing protein [Brevinematales bacterium]